MIKSSYLAPLAIVLAMFAAGAVAQTPDEIQKIEAAAPAQAPAKPKQPRKLLVFTLTKGFKHDSIPCGEKALELLGKKTGAYEATITQDVAVFTAENLKQYDAVALCNTTGELFTEEAQRQALLDFIRQGKGFVGIHAATDCCYQWRPYGEMIGGYFDGHPWTAKDTVTIKIEDTTHPLMLAFPGPKYTVTDEIYQLKDPYSRSVLNVLASLDNRETDMSKDGIKRADRDFAIAWVREYEKGRVFYCSLGHNKHIYWDPIILKHYLAGIQYALGDLEADATPDRPTDQAALEKMLPRVVAQAAQTTYSATTSNLPELELYLQRAKAFPATRSRAADEITSRLVEMASTDTTESIVALQFFGQKLGEVGASDNVPALADLLSHKNPHAVEAARKALELIPATDATEALMKALGASTGRLRIGVINSLGERGDAAAVEQLVGLLKDEDGEAASAAAAALGKIPTVEAARALVQAADNGSTETKFQLADAALRCCAGLVERGAAGVANDLGIGIFRDQSHDASIRAAALILLVEADPTDNLGLAVQHFVAGEGKVQQAAAGLLARRDTKDVAGRLLRRFDYASSDSQAAILELLTYRAEPELLPVARKAAESADPSVQTAAIKAVGKLGNAQDVALLATLAATSIGATAEHASAGLAALPGRDVNAEILRQLSGSSTTSTEVRAELVRALGTRHDVKAIPQLLEIAGRGDLPPAEGVEVFRALGTLAGAEQAGRLLDSLAKQQNERVIKEAERATLVAIRQLPNEGDRAKLILERLDAAANPTAKAALIRVVGNFGGPEALTTLRRLVEAPGEAVSDAAVRALASFPTVDALPDVRQLASSSAKPVHQALAVRGYARLLALPSDRSSSDTLALATEALALARGTEDKRLVVAELAGIKAPGVIALLQPLVDAPDLKEDAMAAIARAASYEIAFSPDEIRGLLEQIKAGSTSEETRKLANDQLEASKKLAGYITAWRVAGPFTPPRKVLLPKLLDRPFPPERPNAPATTWSLVAAGINPKKAEMLDLESLMKGEDRVAYLRTRVWTDTPTTGVLHVGSDDGIKVWWNGQAVLAEPGPRAYKVKSDKATVPLQQGWNYLMLKVTQGAADWGASAFLATETGEPLTGFRQSADEVDATAPFVQGGS